MAVLNQEQRQAFQDVLNFINDPTQKFYRVSGGAGTGKSFFISKIEQDILKHKNADVPLSYVAITATTNKAAAVLKNSMQHKRGEIQTIYSFMNLRVHNDFTSGEQRVVPTAKWDVHMNTLIIVDEASMVNRTLYDYIDKGTSNTCKILFVGDKNQLAPVKENISPVYSKSKGESFLITPVRQQNQQALMDLADMAKDTVLTGKFHPIVEVPGVIDFVSGNQMKGIMEREYHTEDPNRRILCYTNDRVRNYNLYVRELRGYTRNYEVGEMLTNNSAAELVDKTRLYTDQVVEVLERGEPYEKEVVPGGICDMVDLVVRDPDTFQIYNVTVTEDPNDREEVLKYWKSRKKWDRFFKFRDNHPDLRSVAASTTHKAQGSTYEEVIVDLADIGKCTQPEMAARLQYVALTRPKNRLYIRGKLPERFFE
ncbi:Dda-like helicase [Dinoroseobacter phage vB_DshP-R7L]|uniref:DNA helicase n=1 Tax=Dinoroseobacter phage vB_DshP-R7L TaxID=2873349 RepID=A0AAE8XBH5_9CAUD|nr:Dda-like helicase [Dinoroseobacter phage vB_DshP-R7L]UAT28896.1 DNA helicase [Dinoroseobacter phage vB_DshP-R7L]